MSNSVVELSPEAIAFANSLQSTGTPTELEITRSSAENLHRAASEPEGVTYREVNANGVFGIWCEPIGANTDFVLLHSHAGGSVVTSAFVDRKLAGHIAKAVGIPVLVVDFRLAPENKYPAQVDDVETAFDWLVSQGFAPANIVTIGHSIGGFLALAVALRLRDAGKPLPGAIVSISPWADLEIANETIDSNAGTDKILSKDLLESFRNAWIGGTDTQPGDPKINLNKSDLSGLPPTLVSWGTYEVLAGEVEELASRLQATGVRVKALPVAGAQHSYVWAAGRVPETDHAIQQIAAWVRDALAL